MTNGYRTFAGSAEAFFTEKKSRFIAAGSEVFTEEEAAAFLEKQKLLYKEASHYAYAYRLPEKERYSDDREPSGTAGAPVLGILKAEGMLNSMIVVIRYFGGILLGTGGLTHAYGHCAKMLFSSGRIIEKVRCKKLLLTADYVFVGKLQYFIAHSDVLPTGSDYAGQVGLELILREEAIKPFVNAIKEITSGRIDIRSSDSFFYEYPFSQRA